MRGWNFYSKERKKIKKDVVVETFSQKEAEDRRVATRRQILCKLLFGHNLHFGY